MAPVKNRKRKRPAQKKSDSFQDIPSEVRRKIDRATSELTVSSDDIDAPIVQQSFAEKLDLPHVDLDEIAAALQQENVKEELQHLAAVAYNQTVRAEQAFKLLDKAGKGCIVLQDVQQACDEILTGDRAVTSEEVSEMMEEFCSSDELLSKDDIIRIARQVNL